MSLYLRAVKHVSARQHSCVMKGIVCPAGFSLAFLERKSLKALHGDHVMEIQAKDSGGKSIYLDRKRLEMAGVPRGGELGMLAG